MKNPEFIGTCVNLRAKDLNDFDDSSFIITYETFRKHVGGEVTKKLNESFGVPVGTDFAVSFRKGKWKGRKAVCMIHSGIHHLWYI